jgi:hypothetical protein
MNVNLIRKVQNYRIKGGLFMGAKVEDLKVAMKDLIEDIIALSSDEYLRSIEEARKDYKEGRIKSFKDIFL